MAITEFSCKCGNSNAAHVIEYDGSLGYEAIICKQCGSINDYAGSHESEPWSLALAGLNNIPAVELN